MIQMNCPTCQQAIDVDRIIQNKAYCSCGQVVDLISEHNTRNDMILLRRLAVMVVVGVAVAAYMISWRGHAFEIIPLKAKQMLGIASVNDLKSIASICADRQKSNCEIQALSQLFAKSHDNLSYLAQLAEVQTAQNELQEAKENYEIYFRLRGHDDKVRLQYANVLAKLGDRVQAKRQFSLLVDRHHRKPQFAVARQYVHFLMKNHDYPAARSVISRYRRFGTVASMFMNREWIEINRHLRRGRNLASIN